MVVVSAVALSEKVPDPELRPHGFALEVGELLDLDETVLKLVAAGYERVDQVEDRGQFAVRGGLLDIYPATEERAVRVELFDIEIESLRWFSHLHPALARRGAAGRDRARRRARRRAPRAGRDRRARGRREPPRRRRAAAGRPLPRAARPAARAHRRRDRRRRGPRAGAARPLGRRLRRLPRHRRPPPLRRAARRSRDGARGAAAAAPLVASPARSRSSSAPRPPSSPPAR